MRRKILVFLLVGVVLGSLSYYYNQYISLWGLTLSKKDFSDAIIYMDNKRYWVHNKEVSLELATLSSHMKKYQKPNTVGLSIPPVYKHLPSFDVQTADHTTYGGPVWEVGSDLVLDINGYYWVINQEVIAELEKATKTPGTEVLDL